MRVSFLIPAFNEEATIAKYSSNSTRSISDKQVIVIDDGSADDTAEIAESWGRPELRLDRDQATEPRQGAALRAAVPLVDGDIVVIQDADLEYDPADVPALIEPIVRGVADVVYGSRLLRWKASAGLPLLAFGREPLSHPDGEHSLQHHPLRHRDGYKAFRADVLRSLELRDNDFAIEPEITAEICKRNLRVYELPIAYYGRSYAEGKKVTWRDGFKAAWVLIRLRFTS